jgi:hypothetical protein
MNVKVMGADKSVTNRSGNNYLATVQATAERSRLYKVSFSPLAGMAADVYAWIFDLAAGSASSAAPVGVRYVPTGYADTWDFGPDGSIFLNGIYVALSTVAPTDATTTVTTSGSNKLIIKAEVRISPV